MTRAQRHDQQSGGPSRKSRGSARGVPRGQATTRAEKLPIAFPLDRGRHTTDDDGESDLYR